MAVIQTVLSLKKIQKGFFKTSIQLDADSFRSNSQCLIIQTLVLKGLKLSNDKSGMIIICETISLKLIMTAFVLFKIKVIAGTTSRL